MSETNPKRMLSEEAARFVGVSRQRLFQMVIAGQLRAERVGSRPVLIFRREDLERLIGDRTARYGEVVDQRKTSASGARLP